MLDQGDPLRQSLITVDPDTGSITPNLMTSERIPAESLDYAQGNFGQRITVQAIDNVTGLDFSVAGEAIAPPQIGDGLFINEILIEPNICKLQY